jgi:phage-related protein
LAESVLKPVVWVGSSLHDLRRLSSDAQDQIGFALYHAQLGDRHRDAKALKGFGGAGVLEVVASDEGGTYRAAYTVKFAQAVYVLHVFQKKSKRGIQTPKTEIELIRARLAIAQAHYEEHKDAFEKQRKKAE